MPVQGQARRLEHGGPEDAVRLENVLGHQMFARPVFAVVAVFVVLILRPAESGNIVGQGVEPDIADVIPVKRQLNAPFETALRTGDAQILQHAVFQHGEHFIAVAFGPDKIGVVQNMLPQPALIPGHAEEIVLFADVFRLGKMLRTKTVLQLFFGIETLAAGAVMPAVFAEINVAPVVNALEQGLHRRLVRGIGGADETVVPDAEPGPQRLIFGGNAVHELLGSLARLGGGLDDLVAVFIRAREHAGVFSAHAMKTLERIRHKGGVGMPEVGAGIDVVDGSSDVEALHGPYS